MICSTEMALRQIQRCVSHQPYTVFDIPSQSQNNLIYEVYSIFPDDPPEEYICQCRSFGFRGRCIHQDLAFHDRCLWAALEGPETQNFEQERHFVCPRCGGETYRITEDVDD